MEKESIYRVMKITVDIFFILFAFRIVAYFIALTIHHHVKGSVISENLGVLFSIFGIIAIPAIWTSYLAILYHLRKIFISIPGDRYFDPANFIHVQRIGKYILIIGGLKLFYACIIFFSLEIPRNMSIPTGRNIITSLQFLFTGFVIFVVAEVFRLGAELYHEQQLPYRRPAWE